MADAGSRPSHRIRHPGDRKRGNPLSDDSITRLSNELETAIADLATITKQIEDRTSPRHAGPAGAALLTANYLGVIANAMVSIARSLEVRP